MPLHRIGDASVTQVIDLRGPGFTPDFLYPDWDPTVLDAHRDVMIPNCFDIEAQRFIASIHTWVVRTRHHTILIDTCAGNHKQRPEFPRFHLLETQFLERLAQAGVTLESVDYVMCTHLHVDHCGWNTRLVDGRWVPTFPNAKYVFSKKEYDFWVGTVDEGGFNANIFEDSVLPVIESGQALIVDDARAIADTLLIHPTPGHTDGHVSFELLNRGSSNEGGLFTGDVIHQPLQVYRPDWNTCFCVDQDAARASRRWLLEHAAEHRSTVFTAHFAGTSAGQVIRRGDQFDWRFYSSGESA